MNHTHAPALPLALALVVLGTLTSFAQPILPPVARTIDRPAEFRERAGPPLQYLAAAGDVLAQRHAPPALLRIARQIAGNARADLARLGVTRSLPRVPWGAKLEELRRLQPVDLPDGYVVDARNALREVHAESFAFANDRSDASVRATARQIETHARAGLGMLRHQRR